MIESFVGSEDVAIDDILIDENHRPVDPERVKSLARSIDCIGLLSPVNIKVVDYRLISGRHRIEAYRKLGFSTIPARLHSLDTLHAELATIDENIERSELTALEQSRQLKRRKEIYIALHPDNANSFTADTAQQTGVSERTINRDIAVAEGLPEVVQDAIAKTPAALSKAELARLLKLTATQQIEASRKLESGEAITVAEATMPTKKTTKTDPTKDAKGKKIPDHLVEIFASAKQYREVSRAIHVCGKILEDMAKGPANAWLDIKLARTEIENLKVAIKFAIPHTLCLHCKAKGCDQCRQSGYLNRQRTANAVKE